MKLATASYNDVKAVIGEDPYGKSEEDQIKEYNSSIYLPQMVFLGLDERREDFTYKDQYKGAPFFAVDVTPKHESIKEAAEALIKTFEERGLQFSKSRLHLALPPEEGLSSRPVGPPHYHGLTLFCSCHLRRSAPPPGLERPQPFLRRLWQPDALSQCRVQAHLSAHRCLQSSF